MKKLFCFLAVAGTALFTSCSNDDDSGSGNNNEETAIMVSADMPSVTVGETITFTVTNNQDEDVTSDATIYVNDVAMDGNTYEATDAGTFTVHATKGDLTSEDITVIVTENPVTSVTVAVSATSVNVGDEVTFTATTNESTDVTGDAVFYVNDVALDGNTFTPDTAGDYSVYAVYQEINSDTVTFTATEENMGDTNVATMNGTNYTTDQSLLAYLGTNNGLDYWAANVYNQEGEGNDATYPNDVYVYFTTEQVSTTELELPTVGSFAFGDDSTANSIYATEVNLDNTNYADDTNLSTDASMTINAFEAGDTAETQTWSFDYSITLPDGNEVTGNYTGQWGYYDASGRPAARRASANTVKNISMAEIAQRKAQLLARK